MCACSKAFFSFWSREFEKLLVYQDQYFGDNPLWIGNVLEEDSVSAFSQGCLSSPTLMRHSVALTDQSFRKERASSLNSCHSTEVLWLLPVQSRGTEEDYAQQPLSDKKVACGECGDMEGDDLDACTSQKPLEPPMVCAIELGPRKFDTYKRRILPRRKTRSSIHELVREPARREERSPRHCSTVPSVATRPGDMCEGAASFCQSAIGLTSPRGGYVLVAEACRFVFALALTLDLLLGLCPLIGSLLFVYFSPHRIAERASASDTSSISGDCADAVSGPASFPGGYLFSSEYMTATATLCAFRLAPLWNILFAFLMFFLHAALLLSQAAGIFVPMQPEV